MIESVSLSKYYGKIKAVDDLSLKINKGEIFGFLGPNGAGKTTTIRMLMGILKPTSGTASIGGLNVVSKAVDVKRIVGYLPDEPQLYDYLKGREFLEFLAEMHRMSSQQKNERIPELLSQFGLGRAAEDFTVNYSHGMKKKLALCGALLHNPPILILDEPTSGMDPAAVHDFRNLILQLADEGRTIFLSTHILDLVEKICHRIAIIHEGKLAGIGTAASLRDEMAQQDATLEDIFIKLTQEQREQSKT